MVASLPTSDEGRRCGTRNLTRIEKEMSRTFEVVAPANLHALCVLPPSNSPTSRASFASTFGVMDDPVPNTSPIEPEVRVDQVDTNGGHGKTCERQFVIDETGTRSQNTAGGRQHRSRPAGSRRAVNCEPKSVEEMLKKRTDELNSLRGKHGRAIVELKTSRAEVAESKREGEALRKELESTKKLLQIRSNELRGVQAFLDTADKTSMADVRRTVGRLNAETFQLAATLADSFTFSPGSSARELQEETQAGDRLRKALGPKMLELLRAVQHDEDPHCVQLALQACLASYAKRLSTRWSAGAEEGIGFVQSVYEKIWESGESCTSAS